MHPQKGLGCDGLEWGGLLLTDKIPADELVDDGFNRWFKISLSNL